MASVVDRANQSTADTAPLRRVLRARPDDYDAFRYRTTLAEADPTSAPESARRRVPDRPAGPQA